MGDSQHTGLQPLRTNMLMMGFIQQGNLKVADLETGGGTRQRQDSISIMCYTAHLYMLYIYHRETTSKLEKQRCGCSLWKFSENAIMDQYRCDFRWYGFQEEVQGCCTGLHGYIANLKMDLPVLAKHQQWTDWQCQAYTDWYYEALILSIRFRFRSIPFQTNASNIIITWKAYILQQ